VTRRSAAGCPTLDGLGAVGAHAHAEGEHVTIAAMPERAALLAELLDRLLAPGQLPPQMMGRSK